MDPIALLQELVLAPGPPGQESAVREVVEQRLATLGRKGQVDAKGNLVVRLGSKERPRVVVTAHMDEIALVVRDVEGDGLLKVGALGGMRAWKLGEGPVSVLADGGALDGVLSLGSVHTEDKGSSARAAEEGPVTWDMARVFTGLGLVEAQRAGIRPGTRVVVHSSRRGLHRVGRHVSGYFLDDRADLASWLLALDRLSGQELDAAFLATVSEEVGGHGALYALSGIRPDVCVALELGPNASDAPVTLNDQPTVWSTDSFAAMSAEDGALVARTGARLGMALQFQALSRGGSDATIAASHGLCARPITLGIPLENSHGFEVVDPGAMERLAELTAALVVELAR